MEANQIEIVDNVVIERQNEIFTNIEDTYGRSCATYSEMNNTLNWAITLITAQFLYAMKFLLDSKYGLNSLFVILIGVSYFFSILIYLVYKTRYVKFKKELDKLLLICTFFLNDEKDNARYTRIKKTVDEINLTLNPLERYKFERPKKPDVSFEDLTKKLGDNIEDFDKKLNQIYEYGIWVAVPSLLLVPLYVAIKYFFVLM